MMWLIASKIWILLALAVGIILAIWLKNRAR